MSTNKTMTPRQGIIAVAAVVLAVILVLWFVLAGGHGSAKAGAKPSGSSTAVVVPQPSRTAIAPAPSSSSAGSSASSGTATGAPKTIASLTGPVAISAKDYITGYYSQGSSDPKPTTWMGRVKPYMTPAYFNRALQPIYAAPLSPGDAATWAQFQSSHTSVTVNEVQSFLVLVAANKPGTKSIRTTFTTTTTSDTKTTVSPPTTLVLFMVDTNGKWLVDNVTQNVD